MGLEADAVSVAAGTLDVIRTPDVLGIAEANAGKPIPVAAHHAGDYDVVLFLTKETDVDWRDDVVRVRDGQFLGSGGGFGGGIIRREEVEAGKPFVEGEGRLGLDDGNELVSVDGVSADHAVQMLFDQQVVATADVAPHGYFVLAAVLPPDSVVTVGLPDPR